MVSQDSPPKPATVIMLSRLRAGAKGDGYERSAAAGDREAVLALPSIKQRRLDRIQRTLTDARPPASMSRLRSSPTSASSRAL